MKHTRVLNGEIVRFEGQEFSINSQIALKNKKGLFVIVGIVEREITEEDIQNIYKEFTVGQKIEPLIKIKRTHAGNYKMRKKCPKLAEIFPASSFISIKDRMLMDKGILEEKVKLIEEAYDAPLTDEDLIDML